MTAVCLAVPAPAFTSSSASLASIHLQSNEIFNIPSSLGTLDEFKLGYSDKTFILIQDAHQSFEAQKHIADLIHLLVDQHGVKTVFEEGYEGPVPTDELMKGIFDPLVKQRVSYYLMDQLQIGGAEYAHINRGSWIVDRESANAKRGAWIVDSGSKKKKRETWIVERESKEKERASLSSNAVVSGSQSSFDGHRFTTHDSQSTSHDPLSTIHSFKLIGADKLREHFDSVAWYAKAARVQDQIDRDLSSANKELERLIPRFVSKPMRHLMKAKRAYAIQKIDFTAYLREIAGLAIDQMGGISFSVDYPGLAHAVRALDSKQAQAIEEVRKLAARDLWRELEQLEGELHQRLLKTDTEKAIVQFYEKLEALKRLNRIEMTASEYDRIKTTVSGLHTQELADFIARHGKSTVVLSREWEDKISYALKFYETALERDSAVRAAAEAFMKNSDEQTAVLVYGGFHTGRIRETLQSLGVTYAIVSPRITRADKTHEERYRNLMSGPQQTLKIESANRLSRPLSAIELSVNGSPRTRSVVTSQILALRDVMHGFPAGLSLAQVVREAKLKLKRGQFSAWSSQFVQTAKSEVRSRSTSETSRLSLPPARAEVRSWRLTEGERAWNLENPQFVKQMAHALSLSQLLYTELAKKTAPERIMEILKWELDERAIPEPENYGRFADFENFVQLYAFLMFGRKMTPEDFKNRIARLDDGMWNSHNAYDFLLTQFPLASYLAKAAEKKSDDSAMTLQQLWNETTNPSQLIFTQASFGRDPKALADFFMRVITVTETWDQTGVEARSELRRVQQSRLNASGDLKNTAPKQSIERPWKIGERWLQDQTWSYRPLLSSLSAKMIPRINNATTTIINEILSWFVGILFHTPPITAATAKAWQTVSDVRDTASSLFSVQNSRMIEWSPFVRVQEITMDLIKNQYLFSLKLNTWSHRSPMNQPKEVRFEQRLRTDVLGRQAPPQLDVAMDLQVGRTFASADLWGSVRSEMRANEYQNKKQTRFEWARRGFRETRQILWYEGSNSSVRMYRRILRGALALTASPLVAVAIIRLSGITSMDFSGSSHGGMFAAGVLAGFLSMASLIFIKRSAVASLNADETLVALAAVFKVWHVKFPGDKELAVEDLPAWSAFKNSVFDLDTRESGSWSLFTNAHRMAGAPDSKAWIAFMGQVLDFEKVHTGTFHKQTSEGIKAILFRRVWPEAFGEELIELSARAYGGNVKGSLDFSRKIKAEQNIPATELTPPVAQAKLQVLLKQAAFLGLPGDEATQNFFPLLQNWILEKNIPASIVSWKNMGNLSAHLSADDSAVWQDFFDSVTRIKSERGKFNLSLGPGTDVKITASPLYEWLQKKDPALFNLIFNQENAQILLGILSRARLLFYQTEERGMAEETETPLARALHEGRYFELADGLYATATTGSFRRHILFRMDETGKVEHAVEIKMPGDEKRGVLADSFHYGETLRKAMSAGLVVPSIAFVEYPEGFHLYEGQGPVTERDAVTLHVLDYEGLTDYSYDGYRMSHLKHDDLEYIAHQYKERYHGSVEKVAVEMLRQVFEYVARMHQAGFVGRTLQAIQYDLHLENFRVVLDPQNFRMVNVVDVESYRDHGRGAVTKALVDSDFKQLLEAGDDVGARDFLKNQGVDISDSKLRAMYDAAVTRLSRSETRQMNKMPSTLEHNFLTVLSFPPLYGDKDGHVHSAVSTVSFPRRRESRGLDFPRRSPIKSGMTSGMTRQKNRDAFGRSEVRGAISEDILRTYELEKQVVDIAAARGFWGHGAGSFGRLFADKFSEKEREQRRNSFLNIILTGSINTPFATPVFWTRDVIRRWAYLAFAALSMGGGVALMFTSSVAAGVIFLIPGIMYALGSATTFVGPFRDEGIDGPVPTSHYGPYWIILTPEYKSVSSQGVRGLLGRLIHYFTHLPDQWKGIDERQHLAYLMPDSDVAFAKEKIISAQKEDRISEAFAQKALTRLVGYSAFIKAQGDVQTILKTNAQAFVLNAGTRSEVRAGTTEKIEETKTLLSQLVKLPSNFDWNGAAQEHILPDLAGRPLGKTNLNGYINLRPLPQYNDLELRVLSKKLKDWVVTIESSRVVNGYFEFTVVATKENETAHRRTFQIGRFQRDLKKQIDRRVRKRTGQAPDRTVLPPAKVLDVRHDFATRKLMELVTKPANYDWTDAEKRGELDGLKGLLMEPMNDRGRIIFTPVKYYEGYEWRMIGELPAEFELLGSAGWLPRITQVYVENGLLNLEIELTKGEHQFKRYFQMGHYDKKLLLNTKGSKKSTTVRLITPRAGVLELRKLLKLKLNKEGFIENLPKNLNLAGYHLGRVSPFGSISIRLKEEEDRDAYYEGVTYQWTVASLDNEDGWEARIIRSHYQGAYFEIVIELFRPDQEAPPQEKIFQLVPFKRTISRERDFIDKLKTEGNVFPDSVETLGLDEKPALQAISQLVQIDSSSRPIYHLKDFPNLVGLSVGALMARGNHHFTPFDYLPYVWRAFYEREGWRGVILSAEEVNHKIRFAIRYTHPSGESVVRNYQIGPFLRTLKNSRDKAQTKDVLRIINLDALYRFWKPENRVDGGHRSERKMWDARTQQHDVVRDEADEESPEHLLEQIMGAIRDWAPLEQQIVGLILDEFSDQEIHREISDLGPDDIQNVRERLREVTSALLEKEPFGERSEVRTEMKSGQEGPGLIRGPKATSRWGFGKTLFLGLPVLALGYFVAAPATQNLISKATRGHVPEIVVQEPIRSVDPSGESPYSYYVATAQGRRPIKIVLESINLKDRTVRLWLTDLDNSTQKFHFLRSPSESFAARDIVVLREGHVFVHGKTNPDTFLVEEILDDNTARIKVTMPGYDIHPGSPVTLPPANKRSEVRTDDLRRYIEKSREDFSINMDEVEAGLRPFFEERGLKVTRVSEGILDYISVERVAGANPDTWAGTINFEGGSLIFMSLQNLKAGDWDSNQEMTFSAKRNFVNGESYRGPRIPLVAVARDERGALYAVVRPEFVENPDLWRRQKPDFENLSLPVRIISETDSKMAELMIVSRIQTSEARSEMRVVKEGNVGKDGLAAKGEKTNAAVSARVSETAFVFSSGAGRSDTRQKFLTRLMLPRLEFPYQLTSLMFLGYMMMASTVKTHIPATKAILQDIVSSLKIRVARAPVVKIWAKVMVLLAAKAHFGDRSELFSIASTLRQGLIGGQSTTGVIISKYIYYYSQKNLVSTVRSEMRVEPQDIQRFVNALLKLEFGKGKDQEVFAAIQDRLNELYRDDTWREGLDQIELSDLGDWPYTPHIGQLGVDAPSTPRLMELLSEIEDWYSYSKLIMNTMVGYTDQDSGQIKNPELASLLYQALLEGDDAPLQFDGSGARLEVKMTSGSDVVKQPLSEEAPQDMRYRTLLEEIERNLAEGGQAEKEVRLITKYDATGHVRVTYARQPSATEKIRAATLDIKFFQDSQKAVIDGQSDVPPEILKTVLQQLRLRGVTAGQISKVKFSTRLEISLAGDDWALVRKQVLDALRQARLLLWRHLYAEPNLSSVTAKPLDGIKNLPKFPVPKPAELIKFYDAFNPDGWKPVPGTDGGIPIGMMKLGPDILKWYLNLIHGFGRNLKILSMGAGHGELEEILKREGYQVQAVELSPKNAAVLKSKGIETLIGDANTPLDLPTDFDLVIFIDSIGQMNPKQAITHAKKYLKPGGSVFITTPTTDKPMTQVDYSGTYLVRYPIAYLEQLLKTRGFDYLVPGYVPLAGGKSGSPQAFLQYISAHKPLLSRSEVRTAGDASKEMFRQLRSLFSEQNLPLSELQGRLRQLLPPESQVTLTEKYFYANRKEIPDADRFFKMLFEYFEKHNEFGKARMIRLQDFNFKDARIGAANIAFAQTPMAVRDKAYQTLTPGERDVLFGEFLKRLKTNSQLFHIDHHYDFPVLASTSTTVLLIDFLLYLHAHHETSLIQDLKERSFAVMDHADVDILLSHFVIEHADDANFLRTNRQLLSNTVLFNDYLAMPKAAADQSTMLIFYYTLLAIEENVVAGVWSYEVGLQRISEALAFGLKWAKSYSAERLYAAMQLNSDIGAQAAEKEYAAFFFRGAERDFHNRKVLQNMINQGDFDSADLVPGSVRKRGPILFFYVADDEPKEIWSSSAYQYLVKERPELLKGISAIVVSTPVTSAEPRTGAPARLFKVRTFMDEDGHFLNLSESFWAELRTQGYKEAGGRGMAGSLSKSPIENADVAKAVRAYTAAIERLLLLEALPEEIQSEKARRDIRNAVRQEKIGIVAQIVAALPHLYTAEALGGQSLTVTTALQRLNDNKKYAIRLDRKNGVFSLSLVEDDGFDIGITGEPATWVDMDKPLWTEPVPAKHPWRPLVDALIAGLGPDQQRLINEQVGYGPRLAALYALARSEVRVAVDVSAQRAQDILEIQERLQAGEALKADLEELSLIFNEQLEKASLAVAPQERRVFLDDEESANDLDSRLKAFKAWAGKEAVRVADFELMLQVAEAIHGYYETYAHLPEIQKATKLRREAYAKSLRMMRIIDSLQPSAATKLSLAHDFFHTKDFQQAELLAKDVLALDDAAPMEKRTAYVLLGYIYESQAWSENQLLIKQPWSPSAQKEAEILIGLNEEAATYFRIVLSEYSRNRKHSGQIPRALAGFSATERQLGGLYLWMGFGSGDAKAKINFFLESAVHYGRALDAGAQAILMASGKVTSVQHSDRFYTELFDELTGGLAQTAIPGLLQLLPAQSFATLTQAEGVLFENTLKAMVLNFTGFVKGERFVSPIAADDVRWTEVNRAVSQIQQHLLLRQRAQEAIREARTLLLKTHAYTAVESFRAEVLENLLQTTAAWEAPQWGAGSRENLIRMVRENAAAFWAAEPLDLQDLYTVKWIFETLKSKETLNDDDLKEIVEYAGLDWAETEPAPSPISFERIRNRFQQGRYAFLGEVYVAQQAASVSTASAVTPAQVDEAEEKRHVVVFNSTELEQYAKADPLKFQKTKGQIERLSPWINPERIESYRLLADAISGDIDEFSKGYALLARDRAARKNKAAEGDRLPPEKSRDILQTITEKRTGMPRAEGYASKIERLARMLSNDLEAVRNYISGRPTVSARVSHLLELESQAVSEAHKQVLELMNSRGYPLLLENTGGAERVGQAAAHIGFYEKATQELYKRYGFDWLEADARELMEIREGMAEFLDAESPNYLSLDEYLRRITAATALWTKNQVYFEINKVVLVPIEEGYAGLIREAAIVRSFKEGIAGHPEFKKQVEAAQKEFIRIRQHVEVTPRHIGYWREDPSSQRLNEQMGAVSELLKTIAEQGLQIREKRVATLRESLNVMVQEIQIDLRENRAARKKEFPLGLDPKEEGKVSVNINSLSEQSPADYYSDSFEQQAMLEKVKSTLAEKKEQILRDIQIIKPLGSDLRRKVENLKKSFETNNWTAIEGFNTELLSINYDPEWDGNDYLRPLKTNANEMESLKIFATLVERALTLLEGAEPLASDTERTLQLFAGEGLAFLSLAARRGSQDFLSEALIDRYLNHPRVWESVLWLSLEKLGHVFIGLEKINSGKKRDRAMDQDIGTDTGIWVFSVMKVFEDNKADEYALDPPNDLYLETALMNPDGMDPEKDSEDLLREAGQILLAEQPASETLKRLKRDLLLHRRDSASNMTAIKAYVQGKLLRKYPGSAERLYSKEAQNEEAYARKLFDTSRRFNAQYPLWDPRANVSDEEPAAKSEVRAAADEKVTVRNIDGGLSAKFVVGGEKIVAIAHLDPQLIIKRSHVPVAGMKDMGAVYHKIKRPSGAPGALLQMDIFLEQDPENPVGYLQANERDGGLSDLIMFLDPAWSNRGIMQKVVGVLLPHYLKPGMEVSGFLGDPESHAEIYRQVIWSKPFGPALKNLNPKPFHRVVARILAYVLFFIGRVKFISEKADLSAHVSAGYLALLIPLITKGNYKVTSDQLKKIIPGKIYEAAGVTDLELALREMEPARDGRSRIMGLFIQGRVASRSEVRGDIPDEMFLREFGFKSRQAYLEQLPKYSPEEWIGFLGKRLERHPERMQIARDYFESYFSDMGMSEIMNKISMRSIRMWLKLEPHEALAMLLGHAFVLASRRGFMQVTLALGLQAAAKTTPVGLAAQLLERKPQGRGFFNSNRIVTSRVDHSNWLLKAWGFGRTGLQEQMQLAQAKEEVYFPIDRRLSTLAEQDEKMRYVYYLPERWMGEVWDKVIGYTWGVGFDPATAHLKQMVIDAEREAHNEILSNSPEWAKVWAINEAKAMSWTKPDLDRFLRLAQSDFIEKKIQDKLRASLQALAQPFVTRALSYYRNILSLSPDDFEHLHQGAIDHTWLTEPGPANLASVRKKAVEHMRTEQDGVAKKIAEMEKRLSALKRGDGFDGISGDASEIAILDQDLEEVKAKQSHVTRFFDLLRTDSQPKVITLSPEVLVTGGGVLAVLASQKLQKSRLPQTSSVRSEMRLATSRLSAMKNPLTFFQHPTVTARAALLDLNDLVNFTADEIREAAIVMKQRPDVRFVIYNADPAHAQLLHFKQLFGFRNVDWTKSTGETAYQALGPQFKEGGVVGFSRGGQDLTGGFSAASRKKMSRFKLSAEKPGTMAVALSFDPEDPRFSWGLLREGDLYVVADALAAIAVNFLNQFVVAVSA